MSAVRICCSTLYFSQALQYKCLTQTETWSEQGSGFSTVLLGWRSWGEPLVVYICVSFWLLAHESRDLSQNNCCYKLSKSPFFHSKWPFWVKIIVILWICSAFNTSYFCLSLRKITWFMSQQPTTNTDVEHLWGKKEGEWPSLPTSSLAFHFVVECFLNTRREQNQDDWKVGWRHCMANGGVHKIRCQEEVGR